MKLGIFAPVFSHFFGPSMGFEAMLDKVVEAGIDAVDFGGGPLNGELFYMKPDELLGSKKAFDTFNGAVSSRGLEISALACHGNPLHPDKAFAQLSRDAYAKNLELAEKLGVERLVLFSGCPGDGESTRYPNWVTSLYPPEMGELLRWQWEEVVIPYWQEAGKMAADRGVRLAFELHPGMNVYNPATLLRLREAVGPVIGACLDIAHLCEQLIDPVVAVRELGDAVAYVHAKDSSMDPWNLARHGVFAPQGAFWRITSDDNSNARGEANPYAHMRDASFSTRTLGYGHDILWWKNLVTALRVSGYDHVLCIEQFDALASLDEGLAKSVAFLKEAVLREPGLATQPPATEWVDGGWRFVSQGDQP